jgi:hypothetical protein
MTQRYCIRLLIDIWTFHWNWWEPVLSWGSVLDMGAQFQHNHPIPPWYHQLYSWLDVGRYHPEEGSCVHHALTSGHQLCCWLLGHDKQHKSILGARFHGCRYPFSSRMVIECCGDITSTRPRISITLFRADPKLPGILVAVCQTSDSSIHNSQNGHIDYWCNSSMYRFIIPRSVPWALPGIVFSQTLPGSVGIHIGDGYTVWLKKEMGRGVAMHCLL